MERKEEGEKRKKIRIRINKKKDRLQEGVTRKGTLI